MSCWVVPTVAAELWGVSVSDVLNQVESGSISTKTEYGFLLVDVAPQSPRFERSAADQPRPLTYTPIPVLEATDAENEPEQEVEEGELDWKATRSSVARLRRPPKPASIAA